MNFDEVLTCGKQEVDWLHPTRNEVLCFYGLADLISTAERSCPMLRWDTHDESTKDLHKCLKTRQRFDVKECASWGFYMMDNIIYIFFFDKYHTKNHMDIHTKINWHMCHVVMNNFFWFVPRKMKTDKEEKNSQFQKSMTSNIRLTLFFQLHVHILFSFNQMMVGAMNLWIAC